MPLFAGNRAVERAYIGTTQLNAIMHAGVNLLDGTVLPRKGRTFLMSKSSLILDEGTGGPTWSRATKAWRFNERGYLEELASGCAFFGGARLVRNIVAGSSEDLSNASWVKSRSTFVAGRLIDTSVTNTHRIYQSPAGFTAGSKFYSYCEAKADQHPAIELLIADGNEANRVSVIANLVSGTVAVNSGTPESYSITDLGSGWFGVHIVSTPVAPVGLFITLINSSNARSFLGNDVDGVYIRKFFACDVTNYDASYVPKYVSVGVPLNTVRTTSEDFSNGAWAKNNGVTITGANTFVCVLSSAVQQSISQSSSPPSVVAGQYWSYSIRAKYTGGVSYVQLTGASTGFGSGQYCNFSLIDGSYSATGCTATSKLVAGTTDTYDFSIRVLATLSASADFFSIILVNNLASTRAQAFIGDGVKSFQLLRAWSVNVSQFDASYVPPYYAVGVGTNVYFGAGIDGAKYFETDWQGAPIAAANLLGFRREASAINNLLHSRDLSNAAWSTKTNVTAAKTATGLDGIANTATTLTATAADAIILQPTSGIASAARCASAYVKRRTGTGTISFTQDGTNWTNITAQINSSTWSRVQITSTLANPSVGFKIGTSGDAINVDVVQNEAGAVATSPIVTTTATVIRNADSDTYQTASNWSDAAGTAYIEAQPWQWSSGGLLGSATNGLLESASNSGATAYDGTNSANGPTGTPSGRKKLAIRWTGSTMDVSVGGVIGTAGTYDGAMGLASIGIAVNSSGYFGPSAVWNYAMTDNEFKALTT